MSLYVTRDHAPSHTISVPRCLQRHGISRLPDTRDRPQKKRFKKYPIVYFHIDIAEVHTEEGRLYLFVAIDHTSKFAYVDLLQDHHVEISMTAKGEPLENGYAERLTRTIKEEVVHLSDYRDFEEAYIQIGRFIEDVYQAKRIHSALGYLTPVEFEAAWARSRVEQMSSLMPT